MLWSRTARATRAFSDLSRVAMTPKVVISTFSLTRRQTRTFFRHRAIRHELQEPLGVSVDVLTPRALPENFRATVLAEAVRV